MCVICKEIITKDYGIPGYVTKTNIQLYTNFNSYAAENDDIYCDISNRVWN